MPIPAAPASTAPIQALACGAYAQARLGCGGRGRVAARFDKSLYVRADTGAMYCIGDGVIGNGPINVCLSADDWSIAKRCAAGDAVRIEADSLLIGGVIRLSIAHARLWRPARGGPSLSDLDLAPRLHELRALACARAPQAGLCRIALGAATLPDHDVLKRVAAPAIEALTAWIAAQAAMRGERDPGDACARLIGLGPGLTPSGDDLLGAVLIVLRALGYAHGADLLWGCLQPKLAIGTNAISAAHLAAAAYGQGHEAIHRLLDALSDARADLSDALRAIDALGHCSGWDALAGIVLTRAALLGAQRATSSAASSAACALDGATVTPARSRMRTCAE